MKLYKMLVAAGILSASLVPAYAQQIVTPNVPLSSTTYDMVDTLHAMGYISTLPTSKPYTRLQVAQWIEESKAKAEEESNTPQFIQSMIQNLETEYADDLQTLATGKQETQVKLDSATVSVTATNSPNYSQYRGYWTRTSSSYQPLNGNNNGYTYNRGTTVSGSVALRGTAGNHFAFALTPRADLYAGDSSSRLINGYVKTNIGALEVQAGKDELWWGPNRQSSLILSNNMDSLTGVKLSTINPIKIGGTFKFLGTIKPTVVYAKLSDGRVDAPKADFFGTRIEIAPTNRLVLGASLTAVMGGEGRHLSLSDYGKFLTGKNATVQGQDKWDSIAGYDIKWTLPSLEVYGMAYGEDQATGAGFIPSPSKYAWLAGIYVPKIGKDHNWNLRLEGGHTSNWWYNSWSYRDGYVHKDHIIGDYMGNNSERLYARLGHWDNKANNTGLNVEYLILNRSVSPDARVLNVWLDHSRKLSEHWSIGTRLGAAKLTNISDAKHSYLFGLDVKHTF